MKPAVLLPLLALSFLIAPARAEDEAPDPTKLLAKIIQANEAKDLTSISVLLKDVIEIGRTAKSADEVDPLAQELMNSLKLAKGNLGIEQKIIEAVGELRSKKTIGALKKLAFKKKTKDEQEEALQASAIVALSMLRDSRLVKNFVEMSKSRSVIVAQASYACFKNYGPAKGKVRKGIAEQLIKRLQAEKPAAGQSGKISAEQKERWGKLEKVIVTSMQAVCHQDTINDIENWVEWWKENKSSRETWRDPKPEKEG